MRIAAWALMLAILLSACSVVDHASEAVTPEHLTQHWVHSYEEEQESDGIHLFRPNEFKEFAPSRFRKQFFLKPGGECDWYYLAPNDAHYFKPGTWRVDPRDETVLRIEKGDQTLTYQIVELSKNLLRMELIKTE